MTQNNFICKVVNELLDNDFSVNIIQQKMVNSCGGWFDCTNKEFVVALKNQKGFDILIHEYSHFLQWKNRKRYFNKMTKSNEIFFSWLDGKFVKKATLEKALSDVIELEWDCEMQALSLIREYKLDVDIGEYCKAANAYLLYYHMVHSQRKWVKDKSPYNPRICKLMESRLQPLDYYMNRDNITSEQEKEYLKILTY